MAPLLIAQNSPYAALVQQLATLDEDDAALARRIAAAAPARDEAAESELCRRFVPRVRLYGLRHLRNEAATADLVQDVLLLTLQKLRAGAVREPERLASYILGTCRQLVIDGRRTGNRRQELLDTFGGDLQAAVDASAEPLDTDRLEHCLGRLPARERAVLTLTFYDDRSADAVAQELGVSAGNVRVIRHRGIEHLRACLEQSEAAR